VGQGLESALPRDQSRQHIAIAAQHMQSIRKSRCPITYLVEQVEARITTAKIVWRR
jgi:hypothetical protein